MTAGRTDRSRPSPLPTPASDGDAALSGVLRQRARRTLLRTVDGVAIDALYEPGATLAPGVAAARRHRAPDHESAGGRGGDGLLTVGERAVAAAGATGPSKRPAIVLAHGFTGDLERPHIRRIARVFARHAAVVTFSFRGHGRSGGHSTVGDREVLDLAAAVGWARRLGHRRVVTVGFSMGGSVVLRHAAPGDWAAGGSAAPEDEDASVAAVVAVSAPARWYYRGTAPMRRLHWLVTRPEGRIVGRYGFRTRIHHRQWNPIPRSPVESVPLIAPTPLLIVHGDRDPYFPLDHPRMLAAASGGSADLWVEHGMGHAEHAADDALVARIAGWAVAHAG